MVWVFWGLLATLLGGLFILAILARWNRSPLRPAGPSTTRVLRSLGRTGWELLWTVSHPFGPGGWHRHGPDSSRDYVQEQERRREDRRHRPGRK